MSGVQVRFERIAGVELSQDPFDVVTDSQGRFSLRATAGGRGKVVAAVTVDPPQGDPYRVDSLELIASDRGEVRFFGKILAMPAISYFTQVFLRGTGEALPGARVRFRRFAGAETVPAEVHDTANADGQFWLDASTRSLGDVVGSLSVVPRDRDTVLTVPEIRLEATYLAAHGREIRIGVGPNLGYAGRLLLPGEGRIPAVGVPVSFKRTSGPELLEDSIEVRTNEAGLFPLFLKLRDPYRAGEVVGRLHVTPAAPYRRIDIEVRMRTYEADSVALLTELRLQ